MQGKKEEITMTDSFLTPQQEKFLAAYTNPKSDTFSNALQSALKAGYSQEYSESITHQLPNWLSESLGKQKIVQKAERNLDIALEGGLDDPEKGGKPIQWKATEMALRTLKKEEYSERVEQTGANGKDLPTPIIVVNRNDGLSSNNSISEGK